MPSHVKRQTVALSKRNCRVHRRLCAWCQRGIGGRNRAYVAQCKLSRRVWNDRSAPVSSNVRQGKALWASQLPCKKCSAKLSASPEAALPLARRSRERGGGPRRRPAPSSGASSAGRFVGPMARPRLRQGGDSGGASARTRRTGPPLSAKTIAAAWVGPRSPRIWLQAIGSVTLGSLPVSKTAETASDSTLPLWISSLSLDLFRDLLPKADQAEQAGADEQQSPRLRDGRAIVIIL